jgi:hypothetical protein
MKISSRTHPILGRLQSDSLEPFIMPDSTSRFPAKDIIQEHWRLMRKFYNQNIGYITLPFIKAIHLALPKLASNELADEILNTLASGTLLFADTSICYNIIPIKEENCTVLKYMQFRKFKNTLFLTVYADIKFKKRLDSILIIDGSFTDTENDLNSMGSEGELLVAIIIELVSKLSFIKYAEVTTIEIPAGQKDKGVACKYINESQSDIKIFDSTWFTNFVKSDAFKVRGHFRLQPCGEGLKDRKLKWINDFQKEGYTRKAGMLQN